MDEKLLRLEDVRAVTGLCRSSIYSTANFPKPIKIGGGRAVAWISSEVQEYIADAIAASRNASAGAAHE